MKVVIPLAQVEQQYSPANAWSFLNTVSAEHKREKQINGKLRDEKAATAGEKKWLTLKSERKEKTEKEKSFRAVREEVGKLDYANEKRFI